jgi:hypothetical protein
MSRSFDIICGSLKHRINNEDKSAMMLIVGEMGSGKSLSAVAFADKIDPTFRNNPRIVFTAEDFIETIEKAKGGQAIIFDEVGVNIGARDFMTKHNKAMSGVMQILRFKNVCAIFTTPQARFIDVNVRESMNCWVHPIAIDKVNNVNTCKFQQLYTNDDGIVCRRKFVYYDGKHGAAGEVMDPVYVPRPCPELEDHYRKLSIKMKNDKLKELRLGLDEDKPNPMKLQSVINRSEACVNIINKLRENMEWDEVAALAGYNKKTLQRWVNSQASSECAD